MTYLLNPQSFPSEKYSSKKFYSQGHQIHCMLQKVSNILSHLLQDLEIIYRSNGVNYQIGHFHYTLIRILTPFELLTQFGLTNNSNLIDQILPQNVKKHYQSPIKKQFQEKEQKQFELDYDDFKLIPKQQNQKNQIIQKQKQKQKQKEKKKKQKQKEKEKEKEKEKQNKEKQKQKQRQRQKDIQKLSQPKEKRFVTKPILSQQIEENLIKWAMAKLKQNKWIKRKELAKKAVKISKIKNFKGSRGWLKNFLGRHPDLFAQMRRVSKGNKGKKKVDSQVSEEQQDIRDDEIKKQENKQNQNQQQESIQKNQIKNRKEKENPSSLQNESSEQQKQSQEQSLIFIQPKKKIKKNKYTSY